MKKKGFTRSLSHRVIKGSLILLFAGFVISLVIVPLINNNNSDNETELLDPNSSTYGFYSNGQIDKYFSKHDETGLLDGLTYETAYIFENKTFTCPLILSSITRYVIINNCTFINEHKFLWNYGVFMFYSQNIFVYNSNFIDSEMGLYHSTNISAANNSLVFDFEEYDDDPDAIKVYESSTINITGNTINYADRGIFISKSNLINVENNDLVYSQSKGIKLKDSENISIKNNNIIGNTSGIGIVLLESNYNNLTLNEIACNNIGIQIDSSSTNNTISINWLNNNDKQISCEQNANFFSIPGTDLGNIYTDYLDLFPNASYTRVDPLYPEYFPADDYQEKAIFKGSFAYIINSSEGIFDSFPLIQICNISDEFTLNIVDQVYLWGYAPPTIQLKLEIPIPGFISSISYSINDSYSIPVDVGGISNSEIIVQVNDTLWEIFDSGFLEINVNLLTIFGVETQQSITIEKDVSDPEVSIIHPIESKWYGHFTIAYELDIIESNLDQIWYSVDGGITRYYVTNVTGSLDQALWSSLTHGRIDIIFGAIDKLGNQGSNTTTIFKDTRGPRINIIYPSVLQSFNETPPVIDLVIEDPSMIAELYYIIGGNNAPIDLEPNTTSFSLDQEIWMGLEDGYTTVEIRAKDEWGNEGMTTIILQKDTVIPVIHLNGPNNHTYFGIVAPFVDLTFEDANYMEVAKKLGERG
ncbi:MAG: NosD domain-containing protein, partial [Candidatus Hodarchaeota archaeon]